MLIVFINVSSCKHESKRKIESTVELNQSDTIQLAKKEVKTPELVEENPIQILFEASYEKFKFTIEDDDELYVRAYDSSNIVIDELIISHPSYKSSLL